MSVPINIKPGLNNALDYMASGLPFTTQSSVTAGTPERIEFPFVTKFFTIKNNGPVDLYVGFTENGVLGTNKFSLPASGSFSGDIRIKDLFVDTASGTNTFEVIAGMTGILRKDFYNLSGSFVGFSGSQETAGYRGFGYEGIG